MRLSDTTVKVCNRDCVFDAANSDATKGACTLPAMPTITAINDFALITAGLLKDLTYTGTASSFTTLTDGNNLNELDDSTEACTFGFEAPTDYVYVLNTIQIFLHVWTLRRNAL